MAVLKFKDVMGVWHSIPAIQGEQPEPLTGTSAPSANAAAIGLVYIDTVALAAYMSVQIGTGATDWKKITP